MNKVFTKKTEKETVYIYNISGILILHMIFTCHLRHFCEFQNAFPFSFIDIALSFFMPWFFFKSGKFYKEKPFTKVLADGKKRLIIPYVIFSIIGIIAGSFISMTQGNDLLTHLSHIPAQVFYDEALYDNGPLWFLISLFFIKLSYFVLYQKLKINRILMLFCSLSGAVYMNYYSFQIAIDKQSVMIMGLQVYLPYWIGNVFHGLALYALGHLCSKWYIPKYILLLAFLIYLIRFLVPCSIGFHTNTYEGNYFIAFVYNLFSIILFIGFFKLYLNKRIVLITHIGKSSMIYYVCHFPFLLCLFSVFKYMHIDNKWVLYFLGLACTCAFLYICDLLFRYRRFKWMVGM